MRSLMATATNTRHDWALDEIEVVYSLPLPELVFRAQTVHREHHDPLLVQGCALLSVKTGGCAEDCAYCPQSSRYETGVGRGPLMSVEDTLAAAESARAQGATRFCMGAAWRSAPRGAQFERVLEMVRGVRALGLEACCTLGMLNEAQAESLAEAGLTAYNHNLDTSPEYYGEIITTRAYDDRIGMGERLSDRFGLLQQLALQDPHPESVPINVLVPVAGTPLADADPLDPLELVRTIATARILMPHSIVRLSAGRLALSDEAQTLCFLAGASSIFIGDRLLTTGNPEAERDRDLLDRLGMRLRSEPVTV